MPRPPPRPLRFVLGLPGQGARRQGLRARLFDPGSPGHGHHDRRRGHSRGPAHGPGASAVQPLRGLPAALHAQVPIEHRRPGVHRPDRQRPLPGGPGADQAGQPLSGHHRPGLPPALRGGLPPQPGRRAGGHRLAQALRCRPGSSRRSRRQLQSAPEAADGQARGRDRGRTGGAVRGLLPGPGGGGGHGVRKRGQGRGHAALRHPGLPSAPGRAGSGDPDDPASGRRAPHGCAGRP